jgi:uncharacterized cupredoxin-like copper-binding protein
MPVAVLAFLSLYHVEPAKASSFTLAPVDVIEGEAFITPSPTKTSGVHFIMFNVTNVGPSLAHQFIVIGLKKGQTYDSLPISTNPTSKFYGRVDEDALAPFIKGAIQEERLPPGGSSSLLVWLPSGEYALICNVPGHYLLGMRSPFTVNDREQNNRDHDDDSNHGNNDDRDDDDDRDNDDKNHGKRPVKH